MPAAAVIPAPIAYIKVAAVKKLVVGFLAVTRLARRGYVCECRVSSVHPSSVRTVLFTDVVHGIWIFYFEKIRVFKAGLCYEYISME